MLSSSEKYELKKKFRHLEAEICKLDTALDNKADLVNGVVPTEQLPITQDIIDALNNANAPDGTNYFTTLADLSSIIPGTLINVAPNYSALPAANTVPGEFYWVENSQGTSWLPGPLGGTYYPNGLYYSNGTTWIFTDVPFNATQVEVDAGLNNNKFVTPQTFANAAKWGTKQDTVSLTTTGTSGAATLVGSTLNIPQYQGVLTNPVTGTGTAGQVAYFNGTSAVTGSNNLFWDNANGRLGVGTASPTEKLHVASGNATINGNIYFGNGSHYLATDNSTYAMLSSNRNLQLARSGVPALTVDSSLNVVIGTTAASARLHVRGSGTTSATTALLVQNSTPSAIFSITDDARFVINDVKTWGSTTNAFLLTHPNTPSAQNNYESFKIRSDASIKISDRYGDDASNTGLHINYAGRTQGVYIGRNYSNLPSCALAVSSNRTGTQDFTGAITSDIISSILVLNANTSAGYCSIARYGSNNYVAAPVTTYGGYFESTTISGLTTAGAQKFFIALYANSYPSWSSSNTNSVSIGLSANASGSEFNYGAQFLVNSGVNNYNIYASGTAANYLAGNTSIGTTTESARLLVRGSGTTSATTALLVQNSTPSELFKITDDGTTSWGTIVRFLDNNLRIQRESIDGISAAMYIGSGTNVGGLILTHAGPSSFKTSGTSKALSIEHNFTPTSGTATFTGLNYASTINQTGGANGITRGLYVNPTLTAAADWRSIETSNNTGYAAYFAGSADLFLGNGTDIQLGTTTGTKIGTATNQLIGFFNATPVAQRQTTSGAATRIGGGGTALTDTDTFDGYTIATVVKALRDLGLLA